MSKKKVSHGQFIQVSAKIFDPKYGLTSIDRDVFIALLSHGGKTSGGIFPSYSRLIQLTGLSRPSIARALVRLRDRSMIEWDSGNVGRANQYRVHLYGVWRPVNVGDGSTSKPMRPPQLTSETGGSKRQRPQPDPLNHIQITIASEDVEKEPSPETVKRNMAMIWEKLGTGNYPGGPNEKGSG